MEDWLVWQGLFLFRLVIITGMDSNSDELAGMYLLVLIGFTISVLVKVSCRCLLSSHVLQCCLRYTPNRPLTFRIYHQMLLSVNIYISDDIRLQSWLWVCRSMAVHCFPR